MLTTDTRQYERRPTQPPSLLDTSFEYRSHAHTDVQRTWRKFGWQPPCPYAQAAAKARLNGL